MSKRIRMAWLETSLAITGTIDKEAYARTFDVSMPTVSNDIRDKAAELKRRGIRAHVGWGKIHVENPNEIGDDAMDVEEWILQNGVHSFHDLERTYKPKTKPQTLATITKSISERSPVTFNYVSITSGKTTKTVSFHTIIRALGRIHARGYDHDKNEFRDFVVARMDSAAPNPKKNYVCKSNDSDWTEEEIVRIKANEQLDESVKKIVELEYDIPVNGIKEITTTKALSIYVRSELGIKSDNYTSPIEEV